MGYVFDGEVVPGGTLAKPRRRGLWGTADTSSNRVLSRILGMTLFTLGAVVAAPVAAGATISLIAGAPQGIALALLASPFPLMLGWLGGRLWSGRPAPNGFVVLGMFVVCLTPFLGVLLSITFLVSRAIDLAQ